MEGSTPAPGPLDPRSPNPALPTRREPEKTSQAEEEGIPSTGGTASLPTSSETSSPPAQAPGPTASIAVVSKNELKRRARQLRQQESKAAFQAQRRERKRAQRQRKRDRERLERLAAADLGIVWSGAPGGAGRRPPQQPSGITVLLDCQFHAHMLQKELWSMVHQVQGCYSSNKTTTRPVHMVLTSFGPEVQGAMRGHVCGYENWKGVVFTPTPYHAWRPVPPANSAPMEEEIPPSGNSTLEPPPTEGTDTSAMDESATATTPPVEIGPAPPIVYLTADSPNTLKTLDPGTCYVIGSLVDHNRERGLCLGEAEARGIPHARLPIGEYVKLSQRKVLAINHVFDILLAYLEERGDGREGDWRQAFLRVIPARKLQGGPGGQGAEGGDDEEEAPVPDVPNVPGIGKDGPYTPPVRDDLYDSSKGRDLGDML